MVPPHAIVLTLLTQDHGEQRADNDERRSACVLARARLIDGALVSHELSAEQFGIVLILQTGAGEIDRGVRLSTLIEHRLLFCYARGARIGPIAIMAVVAQLSGEFGRGGEEMIERLDI